MLCTVGKWAVPNSPAFISALPIFVDYYFIRVTSEFNIIVTEFLKLIKHTKIIDTSHITCIYLLI